MQQREDLIRRWFDAWVKNDPQLIEGIFTPETVYSESYGPEYIGENQIKRWFDEWNTHGRVLRWDILCFVHQGDNTAAEWFFECDYEGNVSGFNGVTLVSFDKRGKIIDLREFQSKAEHHNPYGNLT